MFSILPTLLVACAPTPTADYFGGGSAEIRIEGGGPLAGEFLVDGATQACLDQHVRRRDCDEPLLTLASYTEGGEVLESITFTATLPYPAAAPLPDCMEGTAFELSIVVRDDPQDGPPSVSLAVEDPVARAADPNADQGGAVSTSVGGAAELAESLEASASGHVSATLIVQEGRNCPMEEGSVALDVRWDLDPAVTAGRGIFAVQ